MRIFLLIFIFHLTHALTNAQSLTTWQEGFLDIHHISTGRGNATFLVFPDGTTMLIDAGDMTDTRPRIVSPRNSARKPNASRSTAAWIVDYIRQFAPQASKNALDYALITHFHGDHYGEWDEKRTLANNGAYTLQGITEVGDLLPIRTLIDRGFDYPIAIRSAEFQEQMKGRDLTALRTLQEYWKFIDYQSLKGMSHQTLQPGVANQIILKHNPKGFPAFSIRNLSANGRIWTGYEEGQTFDLFQKGQYPGENPLSLCLKISYGPFDYFTGGDISGMEPLGAADFNSVEAHLAPVVGPVDVATLNHHGNRDSQSPYFVRTLRPRVWIQQVWSSDHPGEEVLRRITSTTLYPGERDLFATDMLESNELVIGERIENSYKSRHGHVVVRVYTGGQKYKVFILEDGSEKREVIREFGEYGAR